MSNQEKKNSLPGDSKLNPVGKVICAMPQDGVAIGIAQVDLSLAPVGCELYVQPSEGRLKLEVEVANDNAMHWKRGLKLQQERNRQIREDLRDARALLIRCASFELNPKLKEEIDGFLLKD